MKKGFSIKEDTNFAKLTDVALASIKAEEGTTMEFDDFITELKTG